MSGSAPRAPLTLLGADAPACDGDACLVPGTPSEQALGSSPAAATDR